MRAKARPVVLGRLGPPTNVRPGGAHKQRKQQSRAAYKIALKKGLE